MMKHWLAGLVAGIASIVTVAPAAATVVGGEVTGGTALAAGGRFVKLLPPLPNPFGLPDSVGNDNFQSPNLFAFDEDQNIVLTAPLVIDVGSGPLSAGTIVASHYVFFDPGPSQHVVGTVEFDAPVLGIITATANLANSDFLANTGVTYLSPGQRGLEAGDSVSFSGTNRILFDTFASSPGDYVRVLTAFSPADIPEPGTLVLLSLGLVAGSIWRRGGSSVSDSTWEATPITYS